MSANNNLLKEAEAYASEILNALPKEICYHNYEHTHSVVEAARKIGAKSNFSEADLELLLVAAWFHDLGYRDTNKGHEEISKQLATSFLETQSIEKEKVQVVLACIEATKIPQTPTNKLAEALCDADLSHLASKDFFKRCEPLRQEWEAVSKTPMSDIEWLEINEEFLLKHTYFTTYGQTVLETQKQKNLKDIKKKLKKNKKKQDDTLTQELRVTDEQFKKLKKKLEKVEGKPERGIETVFRITSRNHLNLSSMADSKANIMISVNSILISVIISFLTQRFEETPYLIIPSAILLVVCTTTIVFAILATRPNINAGKFTRRDVENRKTNLLFFGNFHKMKMEDYEWGMREMLEDSNYLYGSLIRDIYFLGVVLGKKYRLLRISYTIFMIGIIVSVLAFIIAMTMTNIKAS